MAAIEIKSDYSADELRTLAGKAGTSRVARRLLSIAAALDGYSREDAARLGGVDRQTLRDWVIRFNAAGPEGLADNWNGGRPATFSEDELKQLSEIIIKGPDPDVDGISAYTLEDLTAIAKQRWNKSMHPGSMSRVVRKLGFSRQKTRPSNPKKDEAAMEAFKRGSF